MNIPNLITIARILLVPLIILLVISEDFGWAFFVFAAAGASDAADGALARATNTQSEVGAYLDPLADKLLLVSTYAALGITKQIPSWLVITVISRDVLIIGGLMLAWFMDRPVQVKPLWVSKLNTVVQIYFIGLVLAQLAFSVAPRLLVDASALLVAGLTLASGLAYMRQWITHMSETTPT